MRHPSVGRFAQGQQAGIGILEEHIFLQIRSPKGKRCFWRKPRQGIYLKSVHTLPDELNTEQEDDIVGVELGWEECLALFSLY